MSHRILIIDDEPQIQKFLRISLGSQNYDVITADNGREGIAQAVLSRPDLVILDLGLPDMDGKRVLQEILAEASLPVIVLSVRSSEAEKVSCLNTGAIDYVVKPFSVNELLARVRRILALAITHKREDAPLFDDDNLVIDETGHRVTLAGETLSLTRKEWSVLLRLVRAGGNLVTQGSLMMSVWGPTHTEDTHYLRNVIQKLRQKLGDSAANPHYIETEPGIGYRFITSDQSQSY